LFGKIVTELVLFMKLVT